MKESQLNPGAIYNYFDSKEEIIEAIAEERREVEQTFVAEAAQEKTVVDALRRLRDAFFGDLKTPKERLRRAGFHKTSGRL